MKLTLSFRAKPIQAYYFDNGQSISIGRDEDNDIFIDSLAIAQQHAEIKIGDGEATITLVDKNSEIRINGEVQSDYNLKHGDIIELGKHTLEYLVEKPAIETMISNNDSELIIQQDQKKLFQKKIRMGKLQLMGGKQMGKVINLDKSQVKIGKDDASVVQFVQCQDGYYLTTVKEREFGAICVNNKSLCKQTVRMSDGDSVKIDGAEMLFFME